MQVDLAALYGPVTGHVMTTAPIGVHGALGGVWTIPAGTHLEVRTPDVDWCRYVSDGRWPACVAPAELSAASRPCIEHEEE